MSNESNRYQYEPLHGLRRIRLLSLVEGFSVICPHLHGCNTQDWRFVHASLDDPPPYLAISYVWGDPVRRHRFVGRDGHLDVTESVTKVLNYLTTHYQTPLNIWIDALCIDQTNIAEKRIQLRLMDDVYRNATQVVAWIGEYDVMSLFMDAKNSTAWSLRKLFEEVHLAAENRDVGFDPDEVFDPGCQHVLDKGEAVLGALSRAIDSEWFHRIWVFQEVICGSCILLVATFEDRSLELLWDELAIYLRKNNLIHIGEKTEVDRKTYDYANACIMAGRRAIMKASREKSHSQASLSTLLTEVSSYNGATDPRDLVYALVALSDDFNFDDLRPAYQDSVESVFTDVTSLVLQSQRPQTTQPWALLSLAGNGCQRRLHALPTWVPDWTSSSQYLRFIGSSQSRMPMSRLEIISERAGFDATQGKPWWPPFVTVVDDRIPSLTVRGVIIDSVKAIGRKYPRVIFPHENIYSRPESELARDCSFWIEGNRDLAESVSPYPTGESSEEILWRTLIADSRQDSRPWDLIIGTTCLPVKNQHSHFFDAITGVLRWEDELESPYKVEPFGGATEGMKKFAIERARRKTREKFANYVAAFQRHGAGRILFITTGVYLGLGPPETRVGDEVCLIVGAHVPFLLRNVNPSIAHQRSRRTLVGECYIRGLMHGFGMELGSPQDIELM